MQEEFIFFVRLMQAFEVRPPFNDMKNIPDEECAVEPKQYFRKPILFKLVFVPRHLD